MRRLLVLGPLAALLLGGCFESTESLLLDPAASAAPLQDGTYVADDEDKTVLTVTRQGGWYRLTEGTDVMAMLVTPLSGGAYAVAIGGDECMESPGACTWDYAVLKVEGGRALVTQPNCQTDSGMVGSWLDHLGSDGDICYFTSAEKLQQALAAVASQRPVTTTYTRR